MKKHCLWNTKPLPHYDKTLAICPEKNLRGIAIDAKPYLVGYTIHIPPQSIFSCLPVLLENYNCHGQTSNWVKF